ncbi:hypothetical protein CARUB_v10015154mg, partial [Capsella rubella]
GASTSRVITISDDKKSRRKNTTPRHLSSYGKKTSKAPVQAPETDIKGKGKRVCFKTESDVGEMMKIRDMNCPRETQLVIKEPVQENLPVVRSDQTNNRQDRPEKEKNPESYGFKQCVKLIRQLECSNLIQSSFRQKFLTWFSLKATADETVVVKTFIHSFQDDSVALAEQLVDIFSYCASMKGSANTGLGVGVGGDGGGSSGASCKKPRH